MNIEDDGNVRSRDTQTRRLKSSLEPVHLQENHFHQVFFKSNKWVR